jgi:hypothetical protein
MDCVSQTDPLQKLGYKLETTLGPSSGKQAGSIKLKSKDTCWGCKLYDGACALSIISGCNLMVTNEQIIAVDDMRVCTVTITRLAGSISPESVDFDLQVQIIRATR